MARITEEFMERLHELESDEERWKSLSMDSPELVELREMLGIRNLRNEETVKVDVVRLERARNIKMMSQVELSQRVGMNKGWYALRINKHDGTFTRSGIRAVCKVLGIKQRSVVKKSK